MNFNNIAPFATLISAPIIVRQRDARLFERIYTSTDAREEICNLPLSFGAARRQVPIVRGKRFQRDTEPSVRFEALCPFRRSSIPSTVDYRLSFLVESLKFGIVGSGEEKV